VSHSRSYCTKPSSNYVLGAFFHIIFCVLGSLILLNLMVGVVIESMFEAKARYLSSKISNPPYLPTYLPIYLSSYLSAAGDSLEVEVVGCENLMVADPIEYKIGAGSSDPYVGLTIGNMHKKVRRVDGSIM
jgi:hypothetical protein